MLEHTKNVEITTSVSFDCFNTRLFAINKQAQTLPIDKKKNTQSYKNILFLKNIDITYFLQH